ncbi:MAG: hypothetical protein WC476_12785, partial [Phycisphaerae bacterium]
MSISKLWCIIFCIGFISPAFSSIYWCPDLAGDDNNVNFADLAVFAGNWRQAGTGLEGDFDNSGIVDLKDLRHLARYWLTHADIWGVGTTIQTFNSYPSNWSTYIGSDSSGSSYSWISSPAGYLKANLVRNANNDGVAKIWVPIGNIYPAGTTAGHMQESWMQFDVKCTGGNQNSTAVWFGIFNSAGDTDNDPVLYNAGVVMCGDGSAAVGDVNTIKIYVQGGSTGYGSPSSALRVKMHLFNSASDRTSIAVDVYTIDSEGNVSASPVWSISSRTVLYNSSWPTAMDCFGIRNLNSSSSTSSTFLLDNMYFSTDGAFTGTMPAPTWTIKNSYEGQYNINLVQNPGFEYYAVNGTYGDIPRNWDETNWHGSYSSTFAISSSKVDGVQSLRIYDYSSSQTVGLESEYIPVTSGYVYRASVWATRYSGDTSAKAFLRVRWYDSGKNYISQTPSANTNSTSWTELVKSAATAPVNAAYARLFVYSDGTATGRVYFDDASLILANERINDGDFGDQAVGQIPAYWQVWGTHTGASQNVYSESGNNVVKIVDASTASTSGIYYKVPVSPLVPYRAQADARRVAGTGVAYLYLKFYDANDNQIFSGSNHTASSSYDLLTVDGVAPADTAYARVLLYSSTASEGTFYFDNVSFQEHYQTIKYVSPTGTGDGNTYASPAAITNSALWSAVHTASNNGPVKVIFKDGTYTDK